MELQRWDSRPCVKTHSKHQLWAYCRQSGSYNLCSRKFRVTCDRVEFGLVLLSCMT